MDILFAGPRRLYPSNVAVAAQQLRGREPQVVLRQERLCWVLPHGLARLAVAVVGSAIGVVRREPLEVLAFGVCLPLAVQPNYHRLPELARQLKALPAEIRELPQTGLERVTPRSDARPPVHEEVLPAEASMQDPGRRQRGHHYGVGQEALHGLLALWAHEARGPHVRLPLCTAPRRVCLSGISSYACAHLRRPALRPKRTSAGVPGEKGAGGPPVLSRDGP
mmetsp:Transcript_105469/g.308362  ORF Transcript_105469/g.308362 Transcript_105469/m.308362 type:complete len:222 (-) Transcript_105469:2-667(-)